MEKIFPYSIVKSTGFIPNFLVAVDIIIISEVVNNDKKEYISRVVYKPNNYQFATQGSVSSSTRTLKLSVTTIEKNVYNNNRLKGSANKYATIDGVPYVPLIYKSKSPGCNPGQYIRNGNPKTCFRNSDDYFYKNITNLGKMSAGPTVANNGISASHP